MSASSPAAPVAAAGAASGKERHPLLSKPAQALLWFWVLLGALLLIPSPLRSRLLARPASEDAAEAAAAAASPGAVPGVPARPVRLAQRGGVPAVPSGVEPLQDPHGSMAAFYRALAATAARRPGALTRVLHYGDSLIDQDLITGSLREALQRRYGDGGHGFVLGGKAWDWYSQAGVALGEEGGGAWDHFRLVGGKVRDGRLGLGCAAMESRSRAWATVQLTGNHRAERLEVHYLKLPGGGELDVLVDGRSLARLPTAAPAPASGLERFELSASPQRIRLVASGRVRLFGLVLERRGPGVTWENLPLLSARMHQLASIEPTHWREQLVARRPDLVVLQFGANDSISFGGDLEAYGRKVSVVLRRLRDALPQASCLIVGPLDRLVRDAQGLHSPAIVRRVSDKQRALAHGAGCAFWDGQKAMGGAGAMTRWLQDGLAVRDMVHLNARGSQVLAAALLRALEAGIGQPPGSGSVPRPRASLEGDGR